ncbi:MAG: hypothetical protein V1715_07370 [bacterium]
MKRKVIFAVLILSIFPVLLCAKSGITASFKTGFPLSGTSIGLKLGPLNPYCGLDIARISGNYESSRTYWDTDWYTDVFYKESEYSSSFEGSAMLFIPHVGLKMNFWKAYILGELMLCMPAIEGRSKGKDIEYDPDGSIDWIDEWDDKLSKDDKKMIKDALDFIGLKAGFGAEYFFNEHVSIGGEFGLRLLFNSYKDEGADEDIYDGVVEYRRKWKDHLSTTLGVTYTSFSLNFIL